MENISKTSLFRGKECGTNSKYIYEKYAGMFGWDISQKRQFGAQGQPLYARDVTYEGYSVWCIAHSNLNGTKGGHWRNKIFGDKIEEFWETRTHDYLHDFSEMTTRVVFAKNKNGKYEFLGVYECVSRSEEQKMVEWAGDYGYVKTYHCISKCYPLITD